jgi:selenoprotein W-related protein
MYEFGAQLSAIELIPWESGTFDVSVGGDLVHSMKRDGGFPQEQTVRAAVRAKIQPER